MSWEPVIGLEIHVQLKTRRKMFCRCAVGALDDPNTRTCPVCLALPGTLPVPNKQAIEWTIRLGLALGCGIAERAVFHRKHYFYPDNPKGYQISQYDEPLCVDGRVRLPGPDGVAEIGITRAHLEEDAAKTLHVGGAEGRIHGATASLVDFNRGGTPLVEIVTEPDIRTAEQARRFLQLLRQTVVELGISDAEMEKGSLRFDVNVSVRPEGSNELRTRTELKNMNSFAFAARGIEREIERQIATYESGGQVEQETLHFDPNSEDAPPLRSKEEAEDYRYFPEPDLVPIEPLREWSLDDLRGDLPESPSARSGRRPRATRRGGAERRACTSEAVRDDLRRRRRAQAGGGVRPQRRGPPRGRSGSRRRRRAREGAARARPDLARGLRRGGCGQRERRLLGGRLPARAHG
jgi:aspartyl-tRNA(Asn)/glutamyl-tRNA(Gln) amidotransferase subunit B